MNAKEVLMQELGDLFSQSPAVAKDADNGETYQDEDLLVSSSNAPTSVPISSEEDEETADEVDAEPTDAAKSEVETDLSGFDPSQMTRDEQDACIDAALAAMGDPRMSREGLAWGRAFIEKIYKVQDEEIRNRVDGLIEELKSGANEQEELTGSDL